MYNNVITLLSAKYTASKKSMNIAIFWTIYDL